MNTAASVVQTAGGVLAFLLSSLEHRCAGNSDCGGVLEYIEPMYRGPCIGSIYTHPSRVWRNTSIILSYSLSLSASADEIEDAGEDAFDEFMFFQS